MKKMTFSLFSIKNCVFSNFSLILIVLLLSASSSSKFDLSSNYLHSSDFKDSNNLREKIYLQIDKTYYNAGEDMWYKIYLVNANTHKPEALSEIVYVDLIDPVNKIVGSKIIKIDEGCGKGDFRLSVDLIMGEYTIRAYTNFMRNYDNTYFFRKKVYVNSKLSIGISEKVSQQKKLADRKTDNTYKDPSPDVQFFPEGGYMVNAIINRIGFKAVGENGMGIDITGTIVDNTGEISGVFRTSKFGLGMFKIIPQQGKIYKANIIQNGVKFSYDLPVALTLGVVMQLEEKEKYYNFIVQSSLPNGINNFKFIGKQRNKVVCSSKVIGKKSRIIKVPKNILKDGIVQFTLYDNNNKPLCERLVFVEINDDSSIINISPSKEEYGKRKIVELNISLNQTIPQPLKTNISIAVTQIRLGNQIIIVWT